LADDHLAGIRRIRSTAVGIFVFAFVAFMLPAFCQSSDCDTVEKCQAAIEATPR
jgi:hypothetical protein